MDLKKTIVMVITVVLLAIIFIFCLNYFYAAKYTDDEGNTTQGIFHIIGETSVDNYYTNPDSEDDTMIEDIGNTAAPEVQYIKTTYSTGVEIDIKSLIQVKTAGSGNYVSGSTENGFTVSIMDIMDDTGASIIALSENKSNESDDVFTIADYKPTEQKITFNKAGVYRVSFKVTGTNGRFTLTEIRVPVEVSVD